MTVCGKVTGRLLTLAALSLLAACSDYNSASRAYQIGEYSQALLQFEKLAKAGDVHAQFDLAQMYNQGIGGDANPELGWLWLLQSAKGGYAAAMLDLGMRYESGVGQKQNFVMALSWYRKAAAAESAVACFNIATMYLLGSGVPKDMVRSYAWYVFADKLGSAAATARLEKLEKMLIPADLARAKKIAAEIIANPES